MQTNFSLAVPPKVSSAAVISNSASPGNNTAIIVGVIVGVGGFLLIVGIVVFVVMRKKSSKSKREKSQHIEMELEKNLEMLSSDLDVGKKIGEGEYGNVFTGSYSSTPVLVEPLEREEKRVQFMNEANVSKKLHHPHISQYLGLVKSEVGQQKMSMVHELPPILLSKFMEEEDKATQLVLLSM